MTDANGHEMVHVSIPYSIPGEYKLKVLPKADALPTDTYTIITEMNGIPTTLAQDVAIIDTPEAGYQVSNCQDVSDQVAVTRGGFRLNRASGRFVQAVNLQNKGGSALATAVSLVLDGLSSNAALFSASGTTAIMAPAGSPYINVNVGADGILSPGESATVTLEFSNPSNKGITYSTRVLAGPGNR